jgi:hypothetical protein
LCLGDLSLFVFYEKPTYLSTGIQGGSGLLAAFHEGKQRSAINITC